MTDKLWIYEYLLKKCLCRYIINPRNIVVKTRDFWAIIIYCLSRNYSLEKEGKTTFITQAEANVLQLHLFMFSVEIPLIEIITLSVIITFLRDLVVRSVFYYQLIDVVICLVAFTVLFYTILLAVGFVLAILKAKEMRPKDIFFILELPRRLSYMP